ncbi:penicillin-binding protein [Paroceanicella profunda]|uniref:Penicillin-binding protein n=1 Tax=Paroceanicella profunda TaxID=2579971 RepID=A0A5B8FZF2_9RHOB|nr:transglycosylase domain-containing protein [Paroceanicella profunda]QDL92139.1 penicillin-binding protein [Paroceanicella profunda]
MTRDSKTGRARERPAPRHEPGRRSKAGDKAARPKAASAARKPGLVERGLRRLLRGTLRIGWWVGLRVGLILLLIVGGATGYFYSQLPPVSELLDGRTRGSVTLLDRDGNVFAWRGDQFGGQVRASEVSPWLRDAVLATEDRRFYSHPGVDPMGILRALVANIAAGHAVQGGSTLTQQTAKVVFLDNDRTIERKLKEIPIALAMELKYEKNDILSVYLNRVYLGAGTYGFEAAAQRYFGKSAREVNPAEAAMLAGLLKAPSRYSPTSNLSAAEGRASVILGLMGEQGYLTPDQVADARAHPARLSSAAQARAGGYFADWVMESGPAYLTRQTTEDVDILTTFDPKIQAAAESAITRVFDSKVKEGSEAQAAVVILSPDGAVRAMVGGRDISPTAGAFNRATQATRQTGSVFKPVIYATAIVAGKSPEDLVEDAPLTIDVPGFGAWSPKNYTRSYLGHITLTTALAKSINTAAVRVSEDVGRDKVRAMARRLGMSGDMAPGPALALGTTGAPLLEMTGVYATFLNKGRQARPYGLREIRLRADGAELMGSDRVEPEELLTEKQAGLVTWMLREVIRQGTGHRAALPDREVAGKTGTTSAARDAWFIGFTSDYVVGVWMGYDDNRPLTGVTGGGLPAEIFRETMSRVEAGRPARPLPVVAPEPKSPALLFADDRPRRSDPDADSMTGSIFRNVLDGLGLSDVEITPGRSTGRDDSNDR